MFSWIVYAEISAFNNSFFLLFPRYCSSKIKLSIFIKPKNRHKWSRKPRWIVKSKRKIYLCATCERIASLTHSARARYILCKYIYYCTRALHIYLDGVQELIAAMRQSISGLANKMFMLGASLGSTAPCAPEPYL